MPYIAKMKLKQQLLLVLLTETVLEALEDANTDDKAANDLHSEMEAFEDKNDLSDNDDKNKFTLQNRYLNWDK